jgi:hypothetical protein
MCRQKIIPARKKKSGWYAMRGSVKEKEVEL